MKKFLYDIKIEGNLLKEKNEDELNLRVHETKKKIHSLMKNVFIYKQKRDDKIDSYCKRKRCIYI